MWIRFSLSLGPSEYSVPAFTALHPDVSCDLLFIDGGHMYPVRISSVHKEWW